jgi:hypothetical protein
VGTVIEVGGDDGADAEGNKEGDEAILVGLVIVDCTEGDGNMPVVGVKVVDGTLGLHPLISSVTTRTQIVVKNAGLYFILPFTSFAF